MNLLIILFPELVHIDQCKFLTLSVCSFGRGFLSGYQPLHEMSGISLMSRCTVKGGVVTLSTPTTVSGESARLRFIRTTVEKRPYQSFTGHDAGQVDDLQVSRLRDQRVWRQGDDVVAYPRQGLTLEVRSGKERRRERARDWATKKKKKTFWDWFGPWGTLWPSAPGRWDRNRSSDCSTSPRHKKCFLSKPVCRHGH